MSFVPLWFICFEERMAFLSPALLAGVLLIAVPIALHLRRRRDPVRVEFPALRLLKKNRQRNETQLRLRRLVLLALRCALLAALALALARPLWRPASASDAADTGPAGEGAAIAVVLDNGPNAAYQSRNKSRLDEGKASADWLLGQWPAETPVVLADRSATGAAVELDPQSAALRAGRLRVTPAARPLGAAVRDAVARLAETPASRRDAYVFTDLSAGAWDEATRRAVAAALGSAPGVGLRLVDVGAAAPRNAAVAALRGDAAASGESMRLALGEPLSVTVEIEFTGEWADPLPVQLWLDTPEGPVKREERLLTPSDGRAVADFVVAGLNEGFTTGFVRLVAGDAAPDDDARYFAAEVRRPRSVLIVASSEEDALFYRAAIDPPAAEAGASRRFEAEVVTYAGWSRQRLTGYDAVVLLDPSPAVARARGWRRLYDYAAAGGGVGMFLGRSATLAAFNAPDAQLLLPADLVWRSREETYLRPTSFAHPAIGPLAPFAEAIPWREFPVFQRWEVESQRDGATVVARYADGGPALLEQAVGAGRVVVMTTSVSDRLDEPDAWNLLPTGEDPWPFLLLAGALTDYLTGAAEGRLGFTAGEPVTAPLPPGVETPGFVLRTPSGESVRQTIAPGRRELSVAGATDPGAYRIEAGGESRTLDRRFVVNLDPSAGRLERVPFDELTEAFGDDRVSLVNDRDELAQTIDLGQRGRELYGWVLALAAAALVGEQWLSSRLYKA